MKKTVCKKSLTAVSLSVILILAASFPVCAADAYSEYASAYNKLTVNGGIDADIEATLVMDGITQSYSGNFKVDNINNIIYYEMKTDNGVTVQFSDGDYLYTQQGDQKVKYALSSEEPAREPEGEEPPQGEEGEGEGAPEFDSESFLSEFAGMLEAGKIKELGLLSPIPKAVVSKASKDGNTYNLSVSGSMVKMFINAMAVNQAGTGDTVQISGLDNFKYSATVEDGVATGASYSGDVKIDVPGSLMSTGEEKEYELNFDIQITFVNPGEAVSITLPSTDGYEEVSGL